MVIPTKKTWHYIVGADAHIGPPRDACGSGNETRTDPIRHDNAATVPGNFSQHRTGTPTVYQIGVI